MPAETKKTKGYRIETPIRREMTRARAAHVAQGSEFERWVVVRRKHFAFPQPFLWMFFRRASVSRMLPDCVGAPARSCGFCLRRGNVGEAAFLRKAPPQTPPGKHIYASVCWDQASSPLTGA